MVKPQEQNPINAKFLAILFVSVFILVGIPVGIIVNKSQQLVADKNTFKNNDNNCSTKTQPECVSCSSFSDQCQCSGGKVGGNICKWERNVVSSKPGTEGGKANPCPDGYCDTEPIQRCECLNSENTSEHIYVSTVREYDCTTACKASGFVCGEGGCQIASEAMPLQSGKCVNDCSDECKRFDNCPGVGNQIGHCGWTKTKPVVEKKWCRTCTKVCPPGPVENTVTTDELPQ